MEGNVPEAGLELAKALNTATWAGVAVMIVGVGMTIAGGSARETLRVLARVEYDWSKPDGVVWLVVENIGQGPAQNVSWWFEDLDREDWPQK